MPKKTLAGMGLKPWHRWNIAQKWLRYHTTAPVDVLSELTQGQAKTWKRRVMRRLEVIGHAPDPELTKGVCSAGTVEFRVRMCGGYGKTGTHWTAHCAFCNRVLARRYQLPDVAHWYAKASAAMKADAQRRAARSAKRHAAKAAERQAYLHTVQPQRVVEPSPRAAKRRAKRAAKRHAANAAASHTAVAPSAVVATAHGTRLVRPTCH